MKLEQADYEISKDPLDLIFTDNLFCASIKHSLKVAHLGKLEDRAVIFPAVIEKVVNWAHNREILRC